MYQPQWYQLYLFRLLTIKPAIEGKLLYMHISFDHRYVYHYNLYMISNAFSSEQWRNWRNKLQTVQQLQVRLSVNKLDD